MERLLQMANTQRKSAREATNIINLKCHDLKHQVSAFAAMSDESARREYADTERPPGRPGGLLRASYQKKKAQL